MRTVYICTPMKWEKLANDLIKKISRLGFRVLCPVKDTPRNLPPEDIFQKNIELIKECDIFIAILKDYGKDLGAETGMAYAWRKNTIGLSYSPSENDIMIHYAFDKVIEPKDLEAALNRFSH